MNDFLAEYLKRYGLLAVISALVFAVAVWAFAHWAAAPGEKVSVLWGLAVYTKPSEIHGEISTGPITATQFTPSQLPAPSVDDKSRVQLDPIDLEIAHGLSTDSYFQTVESLHSRHALRELRALETNLPIVATPKGSYFFVFNGYLRFNPRIDERSHLLQANVNRFPNNPSAFF